MYKTLKMIKESEKFLVPANSATTVELLGNLTVIGLIL